ncbi:riboflavin synthase, alpha subunit [Emticicia oligotrophica DSM 17448]|uniref:Riboflavin synthase n=1 Tax=Emticicia oligotrophica (strain DSM 17448 / CIP 109782 / MTCC 6937 / GPTSA100-15) TaxID=929562 RepID=A0ABM5N4V4_EMTOG|nr:riboflavin synthase [Emticicia oligotrophica]AFK04458.1 riboflavin synthase, alpha subunit [Emticicia oligotrophica DSM 17448]
MFTGIVESLAQVTDIQANGTNLTFTFESNIAHELKVDQSVSHNGVCLTVEQLVENTYQYKVTAIDETLKKTNLGKLQIGDKVNLERCMPASGRFDGHIVQGHVDQTGICTSIEDQNGSWLISFEYDESSNNITVEKGSICVNGVSLTVVNSKDNGFSVAIIPYTWEHTNFHQLKEGSIINLEFDILGKYMQKIMSRK